MHRSMKKIVGKALSVTGPVEPEALGKVMMHEHLCSDLYDWEKNCLIEEEKPATPERRQYLVDNAVPHLREARETYGMGAYCDVTMPPWRAWPDVYEEVSRASGVAIILATGFYREIEEGTYFVKSPRDQIWPFVRTASVEELTEMCVREVTEGINGTPVRAGVIKLGSSGPQFTEAEEKAFRAGARAQKETGVHITTHCTNEEGAFTQMRLFDEESVDLNRVVIGHIGWSLGNDQFRAACIPWMKRGVTILPTNMNVSKDEGRHYQPLINGIHEIFAAGLGDKLVLGLDSGYCSESGPLEPMTFLPPHPWTYMFTDVLPAFRDMGMTEEEEDWIMRKNPQRIIPVG